MWLHRSARVLAGSWIAAIGAALAIGALGSARLRNGLVEDGPGCVFRTITGLPCPFCGMTHATLALGHGDFAAALRFHPGVLLVLAIMLGVCGLVVGDRGAVLTRPRVAIAAIVAVAIAWLLQLAR